MNINGTQAFQNIVSHGGNGLFQNKMSGQAANFKNPANSNAGVKGSSNTQEMRLLKRMLGRDGQDDERLAKCSNIVSQTVSYGDSLRESRMKAKETALQLKKLKYEFKSLSAQILRSKTSASAKQVASKARREVIRLKRQLQSGEYDKEELQEAITHAQAMERVAKKKARHLEEEEMVKVTGGLCEGELEEAQEDPSKEDALEDAIAEYENGEGLKGSDIRDANAEIYQQMLQEQMQQVQKMYEMHTQELREMTQDMTSELMDEMSDSMREMLENSGLEELADSMYETADLEMDPADYKLMKIKHRSEEMKAIAKADSEYLRAKFDRLERMKSASTQGMARGGGMGFGSGGVMALSGAGSAMPVSGAVSVPVPKVLPEMSASGGTAPAATGGVDVLI